MSHDTEVQTQLTLIKKDIAELFERTEALLELSEQASEALQKAASAHAQLLNDHEILKNTVKLMMH